MKIAFLSTGDEIISGDIQNTTGPQMARELVARGFTVGHHISVSDGDDDLLSALNYLFSHYDVVICTGGLGPTSDDRTRFAVAEYFDEELHFFDECWAHIVARHDAIGFVTHDNNKQQALFPKEAIIFPNPFGTAYGCSFAKNNKRVFLLPGPPSECMPMFENYVLAEIEAHGTKSNPPLFRWLVFAMAESQMSHLVEEALADIRCSIGYRLCSPYIELKVSSMDKSVNEQMIHDRLSQVIPKDRLLTGTKTALTLLKECLPNLKQEVVICDLATRGHLESSLSQPGLNRLIFSCQATASDCIKIQGLENFWAGTMGDEDNFHLTFQQDGHTQREVLSVRLNRRFLLSYVVELLSLKIINWLNKQ